MLPEGTVAKPAGDEITLLDLATQHSGLPRLPDNFQPSDRANPYADYHPANLYAYVAQRGVSKTKHPPYLYSNLGFGLLGQALAERARTSYANLLKKEITEPLEMADTIISPSGEQWGRFIQGHSGAGQHKPVHVWDIDGLAGAGAIRSTAGDILTYLEAQLHPEKYPELSAALEESHRIQDETSPGHSISLAWQFDRKSKVFEHGGATAGYTSYAFFYPEGDYAAIVLINTGPNLALPAEELGVHIRQRLAGQPAISLAKRLVARKTGLFTTMRAMFAYWATLVAAGAFVLFSVLSVQGLAQLLPRQAFLRISSFLQVLFFCLLLIAYFLQPPFAGLESLADRQERLGWIPSYWFLVLFQELNGPVPALFAPLARRAWIGVAISMAGTVLAYAICYFRTLRKIAEQPDILPISRSLRWLPRLGSPLETAVAHFAIRTLVRSRQHRVILSFYIGISLGLAFFISKAPFLRDHNQAGKSLLVLSFLLMYSAIAGVRAVFSLPLELRANWIFQVVPAPKARECLAATRRVMYGLALLPVMTLMSALTLWQWDWQVAVLHLPILFLFGLIACEFSLRNFPKIPFTCSYLPGKSSFHIMALVFIAVASRLNQATRLEQNALAHPGKYVLTLCAAAALFSILRWRSIAGAQSNRGAAQFEDQAEPAVLVLGLSRDGVPVRG